jgi:hypothetical protein
MCGTLSKKKRGYFSLLNVSRFLKKKKKVSRLIHLLLAWSHIDFAVNSVNQFMHLPYKEHFEMVTKFWDAWTV